MEKPSFIKIGNTRLRLDSITAYGIIYYYYDEEEDNWNECEEDDSELRSLFVDTAPSKEHEFYEENVDIDAALAQLDSYFF